MANSADPDQLASEDIHCLQRQGISGSAGQGLSTFTLHAYIYILFKKLRLWKKTDYCRWIHLYKENSDIFGYKRN